MLSNAEWARLRALRERENDLTDDERRELDALLRRADDQEMALLSTSLERTAAEAGRIETATADLRAICAREERLARRMERFLARARAEQQAIDEDMRRAMAGAAPRGGRIHHYD